MPKKNQNFGVPENFRVAIKLNIENFLKSEEDTLSFPSSFTSEERAYIHRYALKLGLKSKSKGTKSFRHLVISKTKDSNLNISNASFDVPHVAKQQIFNFFKNFRLSKLNRQDFLFKKSNFQGSQVSRTGTLMNGAPLVPPKPEAVDEKIKELPVYQIKDDILKAINSNQVVMICGETGTGKTTQVPQFILNDCFERNKPCRILCMQPRRIAALSMADRVAYERGERVGFTVGYQIKLEKMISPNTLLTFSTIGVLLRTLMGNENMLSNVTHIIVDEVHEREKLSDFLMVVLRYLLPMYPYLKLILMSATLDTNLFVHYFNNCPIITIPSKMHQVKEYFLEDILVMLNYCGNFSKIIKDKALYDKSCHSSDFIEETEHGSIGANVEMDDSMNNAWLTGTPDSMVIMLHTLKRLKLPVDYQHSETSASALMISAGRGCLDTTTKLIQLGARIDLLSCNGWNSIEWASRFEQEEIAEFLSKQPSVINVSMKSIENVDVGSELSEECSLALKAYHSIVNEDSDIDLDLILALIIYIHSSCDGGAILVFLPGYADIVQLSEKINGNANFQLNSNYCLYCLHSNMQTNDQRKVFRRTPKGIRKIILSTNIAETSITIDDVVHVIDCGKVKQKNFDSVSKVTSLQPVWISKSSATQRKGRAGRCCDGFVYRSFSSVRFKFMDDFQCPEILRTPLHELCLQAKSLAPSSMSIVDFLSLTPDPPIPSSIKNSIDLLIGIDALNSDEKLTEIGSHLLDFPLDPMLGKMILYSIMLKCLDPILTIVCSLSYRDPFTLPPDPSQRHRVFRIKKDLCGDSFSDHMVLLRAFQSWQQAREHGKEQSFCRNNFISPTMMEMIGGMRSQLLGQLRASGFIQARGINDIRDLNANSENWAVIKAALFVGMYPNVIRVERNRKKMITRHIKKVKIHATSTLIRSGSWKEQHDDKSYVETLRNLKSDWLVFDDMTRINHIAYVRSCTLVTPMTVALFAGPAQLPDDSISRLTSQDNLTEVDELSTQTQHSVLKLDEWISFNLLEEDASMILHLRQKWHALFLRRIRNPTAPPQQDDEATLKVIVAALTSAEEQHELQQPSGIGQRPTFRNRSRPKGVRFR